MLPEQAFANENGWRRFAANPELVLSCILLAVLVLLSTLQVAMRYLFNAPLDWTQEVSGIVLVWMTFIGAVGLTRQNLHARVELLDEITTSHRLIRTIEMVLDLLAIAFLVCVVIGGWQLIGQLSHERTPALRLPISVQLVAIPITAGLMALFLALRLGRRIVGGARPSP